MEGQTVTLAVYNLVLTGMSSCLSIIGGIVILVTYFTIREIQNFTRKLLVYLTLADLFTAVGNLTAVVRYAYAHDGKDHVAENCTSVNKITENEYLCIGQSFVTTFSNLASFLWTAVIAIHLWSSVIIRTRRTEVYYMHALYHVLCWIVPLIIVLILLHKDCLGEDFCYGTGVWCGIKSNLPPQEIRTWMYIADIGWQIACYLTACFLYIHLKFYLKLHHKSSQLASLSDTLRNEDENFVFVWMVIYLLKLWGFTRFFITTYADLDVLQQQHMKGFLDFLLTMQSYGASGQAFWNCILFCVLDKTVRKHLKAWILRCCNAGQERDRLLGDMSTQEYC
ncbi:G-protein coupled receptor 157-like [Mercenaria mercenaria]|uniref:G-protein coupled receptor 157-like n=1 Tax=Mercenaria mercenaria TaxID=6596 RepID=UPI00234EA6DF|nr:G-protein coupled receptor 157-like [Mercenaria mercenaria]